MVLAALGRSVVMTEPTEWIGGQLTSQAVPPDEHPWIEQFGCTRRYREYRDRVRRRYRQDLPLTSEAAKNPRLNPGGGWVSRLCHEPRIGLQVLHEMLSVAQTQGRLTVLTRTHPVLAEGGEHGVEAIEFTRDGERIRVAASMILDATELGDLLPLCGVEYRVGAESKRDFDEPHALDGDAEPDAVQGITWCAVIGWDPDGDHTIPKPKQYERWKAHRPDGWPGPLLSFEYPHVEKGTTTTLPLFAENRFDLFRYRQIIEPDHFSVPTEAASVMNWPMNDMWEGSTLDVAPETLASRLEDAKQLSLSMLYWLQTEKGYRGLRLRPDVAGTLDGLAMAPYIREARRIQAVKTIREQDIASHCHPGLDRTPSHWDSIGVGCYRLDLHPRANGRPTLDMGALPFELPLGSLVPVAAKNVIPACKNLGVTHIANGSTRLHPVEWNIGEAAALLAHQCLAEGREPQSVYADKSSVEAIQQEAVRQGIELKWPVLRGL